MQTLDFINTVLNRFMAVIAGICLVGIMVVMVLNMILRVVYVPMIGTYDYVSWLGVVAIGFALGYTQLSRDHVSVDILLESLPTAVARFFKALMMLASVVFFGVLTWWMIELGQRLYETGSGSRTLHWAEYPFAYLIALGTAAMTLALFVDFIRDLRVALTGTKPGEGETAGHSKAGPSDS